MMQNQIVFLLFSALLLQVSVRAVVDRDAGDQNGFEPTIDRMNGIFREMFSTIRNGAHNLTLKEMSRKSIANRLSEYGLIVEDQVFHIEGNFRRWSEVTHEEVTQFYKNGTNVIGVLPGKYRNVKGKDSIVLIGSHYDTVERSPGANDNGAGMVAFLELARIISAQPQLNYTVMFVAFDMEEAGYEGSREFVNKYLIPEELIENEAKFHGAYIFDNLMIYDERENSQIVTDAMKMVMPRSVLDFLEANHYKGDFVAVISRPADEQVSNSLTKQAKIQPGYKLLPVEIPVGDKVPDRHTGPLVNHFLRSDHRNFWFHNHPVYNKSLPAVQVTDTCEFRASFRACYHNLCDDFRFLTRKNLIFLKNTVDVIARAVLTNPWQYDQ